MSTLLSTPSPATMDQDDLRELMRSVTETTSRLEATHNALQKQVSTLRQELAEANARIPGTQAKAAASAPVRDVMSMLEGELRTVLQYMQELATALRDRPEAQSQCTRIAHHLQRLQETVAHCMSVSERTTASPQVSAVAASRPSQPNGVQINHVSSDQGASLGEPDGVVCDGGVKLDDIERSTILATLQHYRGHRQKSAQALGIGVRTLGLKLRKWKDLKIVDESL